MRKIYLHSSDITAHTCVMKNPVPGHAGVVIGMTEDGDMILNNPWLCADRLVKWKDFRKGWELEYNKVVMIYPVTQTRLEVD